MKRQLLAALALACALFSAACGSGNGKKQLLVAFSQANNAEPYRAMQNALMQKLWAQYPDVKLVISDAQQDNSKQVAQVETFIRQKPDLLIVAPNERAALTAVMGQAMEAGIPVICLERDILQPNYTTYVHSDNVAIGRMAGQFIVDYLTKKYGEPKGNIVAMRGLLGRGGRDQSRQRRRRDFRRSIPHSDRGRSGGRLDSGQGQGPHDRGAPRCSPKSTSSTATTIPWPSAPTSPPRN